MAVPAYINPMETRIGAQTGPTQGTGIRKRISKVLRLSGQFRNSFKKI